MKTAAAVVMLTLAVAGCSEGEPEPEADVATPPADSAAAFPEDRWTEQEIVNAVGLREDGGWYYYDAADGLECEIAVVMTSANMVAMYADAGDLVATNPDQTAGVKIGATDDDRACHSALTTAFASLA